jgi:hypothetical protein
MTFLSLEIIDDKALHLQKEQLAWSESSSQHSILKSDSPKVFIELFLECPDT